jgi:hypothetical protein
LRCPRGTFSNAPVQSTWLLLMALISSAATLSLAPYTTFLGKPQIFQIFLFCFLLTIFTINLTKNVQKNPCHSLNALLP